MLIVALGIIGSCSYAFGMGLSVCLTPHRTHRYTFYMDSCDNVCEAEALDTELFAADAS